MGPKGSLLPQSKHLGDVYPREFYRMTALATWRASRYSHHRESDPTDSNVTESSPNQLCESWKYSQYKDDSNAKQTVNNYYKFGGRHDKHHHILAKYQPAYVQDTYKNFIDHIAKVSVIISQTCSSSVQLLH